MYYLGGGLCIFHRGGLKKWHIPYPIIYLSEGLSPSQLHIVNPKIKNFNKEPHYAKNILT